MVEATFESIKLGRRHDYTDDETFKAMIEDVSQTQRLSSNVEAH